ncbi:HIVEP [Mytilus edulis]|uniref:HIVEP n=1 Tax=Mytilus edulis TaxID=6550 RepID=A0A8S3RFI5_MYTED|nr:HIVEP [Mytilus edulis]
MPRRKSVFGSPQTSSYDDDSDECSGGKRLKISEDFNENGSEEENEENRQVIVISESVQDNPAVSLSTDDEQSALVQDVVMAEPIPVTIVTSPDTGHLVLQTITPSSLTCTDLASLEELQELQRQNLSLGEEINEKEHTILDVSETTISAANKKKAVTAQSPVQTVLPSSVFRSVLSAEGINSTANIQILAQNTSKDQLAQIVVIPQGESLNDAQRQAYIIGAQKNLEGQPNAALDSHEKRNLSLEALFQVTDNELQNISKTTPLSPQQLIIDDSQKVITSKFLVSVPSSNISGNQHPLTQTAYVTQVSLDQASKEMMQVGGKKTAKKPGKYICSFCGRGCAKPSVLQKHLRAHTGERPYPCDDCGFHFKTKSNLYKHCKSRTHRLKVGLLRKSSNKISGLESKDSLEIEENSAISESETESETEVDDKSLNVRVEYDQGQVVNEAIYIASKLVDNPLSRLPIEEHQKVLKMASHIVPEIEISMDEKSKDPNKKEQAQNHVLKEVMKYLGKPKEERPKIEVPEIPDTRKPFTEYRRPMKSLDRSKSLHDKLKAKLERSISLTEPPKVPLLKRSMSTLADPKAIETQFLKIAPKQKHSTQDLMSQISQPQKVIVQPTDMQEYSSKALQNLVQNSIPTSSVLLPIKTSQPKSTVNQVGQIETAIIPPKPTPNLAGHIETINLPNADRNPAETTKALQDLEKLTENFQQASKAGTKLTAAVTTLPDGSCQVVIHYHPQQQTTQSAFPIMPQQPITTQSPTRKQDSKVVQSADILSERIQNLIRANAAIVSTPMADAPRHRKMSRQNSEILPKTEPQTTKLPPQTPPVSGNLVRKLSLENLPSSLQNTVILPNMAALSQMSSSGVLTSTAISPSVDVVGDQQTPLIYILKPDSRKQTATTKSASVMSPLGNALSIPVSMGHKVSTSVKLHTVTSAGSIDSKNHTLQTNVSTSRFQNIAPVTKPLLTSQSSQSDGYVFSTTRTKDLDGREITVKIKLNNPDETPDGAKQDGQSSNKLEVKGQMSNNVREDNIKEICKCIVCGCVFKNKYELGKHERIQCKFIKITEGQTLQKPVLSGQSLAISENHNKKRGCVICGNVFKNEYELSRHQQVQCKSVEMEVNGEIIKMEVNKDGDPVSEVKMEGAKRDKSLQLEGLTNYMNVTKEGELKLVEKPLYGSPQVASPGVMSLGNAVMVSSSRGRMLNRQDATTSFDIMGGGTVTVKTPVHDSGKLRWLEQKNSSVSPSQTNRPSSLESPQLQKTAEEAKAMWKNTLKQKILMKRSLSTDKLASPSGRLESPSALVPQFKGRLELLPASVSQVKGRLGSSSASVSHIKEEEQEDTDSWKEANPNLKIDESTPAKNHPILLKYVTEPVAPHLEESQSFYTAERLFDSDKGEKQISNVQIGKGDNLRIMKGDSLLEDKLALTKELIERLNIIVPVVMEQAIYRSPQIDSGTAGFESHGSSDALSPSKGTTAQKVSKLKAALTSKEPLKESIWNKFPSRSRSFSESDAQAIEIKEKYPLLLHGHSFPSLKSSTYASFCCLQRPQPMYVMQSHSKKVSMYSNWRVARHDPNPEGLTSKMLLSLYSTSYSSNPVYNDAHQYSPKGGLLTHSSYWTFKQNQKTGKSDLESNKKAMKRLKDDSSMKKSVSIDRAESSASSPSAKRQKISGVEGGFKSLEDYTYVRGRGRGKYVCSKCGIRCKKPSMLKKHIRTHTNLRPYHCKTCRFSFKTKGNLTKHMKSKSHHKKCVEKGIVPVPTQIDESQIDQEALKLQCEYSKKAKIKTKLAETGDEENEEDTDDADEESDEGEPMEDDEDENDVMDADDENLDSMDNGDDIRMDESDETSKDVEISLSSSSSGAGLFSSRPAMCAKLLPDHVSVTTTTESKTLGRSDSKMSSSLGTVYGFSSRKDSSSSDKSEGLQSEVAKSLLALAEQKSSSSQGTSQDKVEQPYWLIGEPRVQLSTSESMDNEKAKILPPSSASLPVGNVMVVSPSPESVSKKSLSDSDNTDSSNISKDSKAETKENLPEKLSSEKPERPKDLFVTVPLGGYMPPMRRTPGVSPKQQGQQGSFDLAKLFKLTENAVRNSKQALRIESPAFQFSHPFPNMATITKDGLVVMATSPGNNPNETILVTSIEHEIEIESEPIKSQEIESKMISDVGKEDRKVLEEKYVTLSENHVDESDDVEFIKEVTVKDTQI